MLYYIYGIKKDINMIKTIIFDFNGTLLDDVEINCEIFNLLARDYSARSITMKEYKEVFDFPVIDAYRKWGFDVDNGNFESIATSFHNYYNSMVYEKCDIFENAKALLKELKGKYDLVCLSASKAETLVSQLKHYDIYSYFDEVLGMSDKYAHGKEDLAKKWMEASKKKREETLYIGDTCHDQLVAKALGVKMLSITWGHNSKHKLSTDGACIIDDIMEVKKYL